MKVYAQIIVSRDGYIAGVGDDISWISEKTREQYTRTIRGMGNCIVGRRAYQVLERQKVILSNAKDLNNNKDSSVISFTQNDNIQNPETESREPETNTICFQTHCFSIEIADTFASRQQ